MAKFDGISMVKVDGISINSSNSEVVEISTAKTIDEMSKFSEERINKGDQFKK